MFISLNQLYCAKKLFLMIPLFDEVFETGGSIKAASTLYFATGVIEIPINIGTVIFWINKLLNSNLKTLVTIMNHPFYHTHINITFT